MKRLLCLCLGLAAFALRADPPVKMAPYRVSDFMLSIKIGTMMAQNFSGQWVKSMWIRSIKPHSLGARAGLVGGMEILAIQGQSVQGLHPDELARVLQQTASSEVVLLVQRTPKDAPVEIHIPLPH